MESRSTARICSPSALHIERSPECRRATSSASRCARENSAQIPSRLIGAVSMMRAPFGQYSSRARGPPPREVEDVFCFFFFFLFFFPLLVCPPPPPRAAAPPPPLLPAPRER